MKNVLSVLFAAIASIAVAHAGESRDPILLNYVSNAVQQCPGSSIKLETVDGEGPAGFTAYRVTTSSTDERCNGQTYFLVAKKGSQVFLSDVFVLPVDSRPLDQRLKDLGDRLLKKTTRVKIAPAQLPDGVWQASIIIDTPQGPMGYRAFVDSSQQYMLSGRRGSLSVPASKTLVADLKVAESGVHRPGTSGPIQIVEISDLQCPSCKKTHEKMEPWLKQYGSKVTYTRIDLPIFEHHDWSMKAALAARAIYKVAPAKYWSFVDFIFKNQDEIKAATVDQTIKDFVSDNDLDWKKIEPLYKSPTERAAIVGQIERAYNNGIYATPTILVNGKQIFYGSDASYIFEYLNSVVGAKKK
jgi:protein-disulfide isomerase